MAMSAPASARRKRRNFSLTEKTVDLSPIKVFGDLTQVAQILPPLALEASHNRQETI